jgi:hypothetical protein
MLCVLLGGWVGLMLCILAAPSLTNRFRLTGAFNGRFWGSWLIFSLLSFAGFKLNGL